MATTKSATIRSNPKNSQTGTRSSRNTTSTIRNRATQTFDFLRYQHLLAVLVILVAGVSGANGLKCHMCGQYNEGVGSITPCLNYSDQYAHLYLKECTKSSEKFCVKYVSELSTVRDCATECVEKEIWETQTYCCNQDGCNGATTLTGASYIRLFVVPLIYVAFKTFFNALQEQRLRH